MSSLTVVTRIHAELTVAPVRPPAPVLRLSPLLRYALATARPRPDGRPLLLPLRIPRRCCHGLFSCRNKVRWIVGDGRNHVFFCDGHVERYWEAGHDVQEHSVEWL